MIPAGGHLERGDRLRVILYFRGLLVRNEEADIEDKQVGGNAL